MSAQKDIPPSASERDIFLAAAGQAGVAERVAFLNGACGNDQALRDRVEELLREHDDLGGFLETPALASPGGPSGLGPHGTELISTVTELPGDRIDRYKLLQKIGEGGCGVVYMAEQEEPVRRRVALKVIKLGMDTRSVIARFEAERQALAMMEHPNIAKVLDAGATATGRPYFVMELVRGIKITEYCDENNLPTEERLALFIQVCQAIQHAHQKGIIHRDIKPSNILVTLHDATAVPKVIDFGIAKATGHRLTEKTLFTEFTAFVGTPAYMSPEQAQMSGLDIDTRSDIYSLGVLLYELLTGKTPFDAETLLRGGLDECRRTIREVEPARPSTRLAALMETELTTAAQQRRIEAPRLVHLLQGDLDWIAMKCLEKDRTRRYDTTTALATDIQCYLDGKPVLARPPSNVYRLQKFAQRHRRALAAAACIAITLFGGIIISTWQAWRATLAEHRANSGQQREAQLRRQAERERERAEHEKSSARLNEYVADVSLANQALTAGNLGRAVQLLDKHRPKPGEPDLRGFEWRYLWQLCQGDEHIALPDQDGPVQALAYSPGGEFLALGGREKLSIFDLRTRSLVTNIAKGAVSLAFLPDGKTLVSAGPITVRAWRVSDWTEQKSLPTNSGPLALSGDGKRLATVSWAGVHVWDTSTWRQLRTIPDASAPVALSADGRRVAADTKAGLTVWSLDDSRSGIVMRDSTNLFGPAMFGRPGLWSRPDRALAFSPDGESLVAPRNSLSERGVFVLSIWNSDSGEEEVMPEDPEHIEHTGSISSLAFSPNGRMLATASFDHSIRLWDFGTRQRLSTLQGHLTEVWSLAFSPDGQTLASAGRDGGVKVWSTRIHSKEDVIRGTWQPLAFAKDGRTLAALNRDRAVVFLNVATREPEDQFQLENAPDRGRFRFGPPSVAFSADLQLLAHPLEDGRIQLWHAKTHDQTTLNNPDGRVDFVALSPNARILITASRGRPLRWWDLTDGTSTAVATEAHRVLFSPDGGTLAAFHQADTIDFWDVASRSRRTNLVLELQPGPAPGPGPGPGAATFSPDGRLFAIVGQDNTIRLWDTATARLFGACTGHKQSVSGVAFSPDGKTLATASDDSTLKLWNVATQQELLSIRRLGGAAHELLFSPNGRLLVGARGLFSRSGGLRLYQAPSLGEIDIPNPGRVPTPAPKTEPRAEHL